MPILLVDNYDSFTFNLQRYLQRLGADVFVSRNDSLRLLEVAEEADAIVISPGPCGPEEAGQSVALIQQLSGRVPILGICLGHQAIYHAFGGEVVRAHRPIHGQSLPIALGASLLFQGIEEQCCFARYHSLVADANTLPTCLQITGWSVSDDQDSPEVMAIEHVSHLTYGVQFHPESILSLDGYRILANFLTLAGLPIPQTLPSLDLANPHESQQTQPVEEVAEHSVVLPVRPAKP